jgi:hypothetical protein
VRVGFRVILIGLGISTLFSVLFSQYKNTMTYYYHVFLTLFNLAILLSSILSYVRRTRGDGGSVHISPPIRALIEGVIFVFGISAMISLNKYSASSSQSNIPFITALDVLFFGAHFVFSAYRELNDLLSPLGSSRRQYALAATQDLEMDEDVDLFVQIRGDEKSRHRADSDWESSDWDSGREGRV